KALFLYFIHATISSKYHPELGLEIIRILMHGVSAATRLRSTSQLTLTGFTRRATNAMLCVKLSSYFKR
ncbi:MAG: hypothetical protein L3J01_04670, partial [Thiomicrorhabdus sp.]|nr:hypothetical protein [Thiomicrorhabdus sp.]